MLYCSPLVTLNCKEKRPMLDYRKPLRERVNVNYKGCVHLWLRRWRLQNKSEYVKDPRKPAFRAIQCNRWFHL